MTQFKTTPISLASLQRVARQMPNAAFLQDGVTVQIGDATIQLFTDGHFKLLLEPEACEECGGDGDILVPDPATGEEGEVIIYPTCNGSGEKP